MLGLVLTIAGWPLPRVSERVPDAPEARAEEVVELVGVAHALPVRTVQVDTPYTQHLISFGIAMVLILDITSEMNAHVRSNLCYFICFRHLIRSGAVTNRIFFLFHACATCSELPSDISTMI